MKNKCGFEQREQVAKLGYWRDKRWQQVTKLRKEKKYIEANGLVMKIRSNYGID